MLALPAGASNGLMRWFGRSFGVKISQNVPPQPSQAGRKIPRTASLATSRKDPAQISPNAINSSSITMSRGIESFCCRTVFHRGIRRRGAFTLMPFFPPALSRFRHFTKTLFAFHLSPRGLPRRGQGDRFILLNQIHSNSVVGSWGTGRLPFWQASIHILAVAELFRDLMKGGLDMDHPQSDKITLRVAPDVRRALEQWAQDNLSTMTAELNRSVRLRARMEAQHDKAAVD